jgi:hypothetical protein
MDFDKNEFIDMIIRINPLQVNIGADSGRNDLPEPSMSKIEYLITALEENHIKVHKKKNLNRLYEQKGKVNR